MEDYTWEVGIWMEKLRQGHNPVLVQLLLAAVKHVFSDPNELNSEVMRYITSQTASGAESGLNLWNIVRQTKESLEDLKDMESFQAGKYFSPLLPAVLRALENFPDTLCQQYVHCVIKSILHYQEQPQALCKFLTDWAGVLPKSLIRYVSIWSPDGRSTKRPHKEETLEPFCFPAAGKLEDLFLNWFFVQKRKSASLEEVVDSITLCNLSMCRSVLYQTMFYIKTCFDNKEVRHFFLLG